MPMFCTKCGKRNDDLARFCEDCGAPLGAGRAPSTTTRAPLSNSHVNRPDATASGPISGDSSRKLLYAGAAVCAVLVAGGAAAYFALRQPAPSSSNLLAAAKAGFGKSTTDSLRRDLCIGNTDYSKSTFNAGADDHGTQTWMNVLVSAGLYSPPVAITSGGPVPGNLLQYVATPELGRYREGTRLCFAKDVEIAEVVEIEEPRMESWGGREPKVMTVRTKVVIQSIDTAPWMEKPEVRRAALANLEGWEYKDRKLQRRVANSFGLHEGRWVTGPAYAAIFEGQSSAARRGGKSEPDRRQQADVAGKEKSGGLFSMLSGFFSFGGHPLQGTWRMDSEAMGQALGMRVPGGLGMETTLKFTGNSFDSGGQSMKCTFEVDGDRVKVTPQGQAASLVFVMLDKDTAMIDVGLVQLRYKRVN